MKKVILTFLIALCFYPGICLSQDREQLAEPGISTEQGKNISGRLAQSTFTLQHAIILGVVEGLTEFIPVSSTGHLILVNHFFEFDNIPESDGDGEELDNSALSLKKAVDTYSIVIQFGAIVAVIFLFHDSVFLILAGIFRQNREGLLLARNLAIAFLPAAFFGLLLEEFIDRYLFNHWTVISALFTGAIFMFYLDKKHRQTAASTGHESDKKLHALTIRESLLIGLLQSIAMWPGMSRSLMAIAGGYFAGLNPRKAAEFSFLLGLPTLSAAALYKLLGSNGDLPRLLGWGPIIVGIAVSCLAASLAMKWLIEYLNKNGLSLFAWYRIGLAGVVLLVLLVD